MTETVNYSASGNPEKSLESYTDIELQNLSRSKDGLVRAVAARYYVERDTLRNELAKARRRDRGVMEPNRAQDLEALANTLRGLADLGHAKKCLDTAGDCICGIKLITGTLGDIWMALGGPNE